MHFFPTIVSIACVLVFCACGESEIAHQQHGKGSHDPQAISQKANELHNGKVLTPSQANTSGVVSLRAFRWKFAAAILGGKPVEDKEGPSGFGSSQAGYCSGIIYKQQWVITAKHCWMRDLAAPVTPSNNFGAEIFDGSLGRVDISYNVAVHPDLDIAVVHLERPTCKPDDKTTACTGTFLSAATPGDFQKLKISSIECAGYANLDKGNAKPTSGIFLIDLKVNENDFTNNRIQSIPFFSTVENKSIEEQKIWWKRQTCEGAKEAIGGGCIYSTNRLSDICQYKGTFDDIKCLPPPGSKNSPLPIIARGDSGGPCFASTLQSRSLIGITVASRRDDRTGNGTILNEATNLGFAWPWLASQGLVSLPQKTQAELKKVAIPAPSDPQDYSHFLVNLSDSTLFDFVRVGTNQILWAKNNGSGLDSFKTIASEAIDPDASYFFDFDQDNALELIWLKSNEFKVRKPEISNGILENFQPDTSYSLPFVAEGPWSEATAFLLPVFGTSYYGMARIDKNLFRFLPWNPIFGFDTSQQIEFFLNQGTNVSSFDVVDFLYLDNNSSIDFVGFNPGKIIIKKGIMEADFTLPIERTITGDCKSGSFRTMIDLNGDSQADYLCIDDYSIKSWISTSPTFQLQTAPFVTNFDITRDWKEDVTLVDMNLDGILDVVVVFRTKGYTKDSLGFINRINNAGYVLYHLGQEDGRFGKSQLVRLPDSAMADVAASGSSNVINYIAEIESGIGNDIAIVGKNKIWLQPQIVDPKINVINPSLTTGTRMGAQIPPWRRLIWKKNRLR